MRGRTGYYDAAVVERIEAAQRLHADGFTLDLIRRLLEAGTDVMDLAEVLRAPFHRAGAGASMAQVVEQLNDLGIPPDEVRDTTLAIRRLLDDVAELFEGVWLRNVWQPFLDDGMPPERVADLQQTAARVQPLAGAAVNALFTAAMESRVEQGIARELSAAAERSR
jgi:hypothetical protein